MRNISWCPCLNTWLNLNIGVNYVDRAVVLVLTCLSLSHLSPGVSLIYDLAHDSGMLQSELFTSRNQNLVLAKLPNSGFWRYGQFFK